MKHLVFIMILATMIALSTVMANSRPSLLEASSTPNIYVSPTSKLVQIGREFTIDIDVDNVSNLYGYEIWMNFDNNKLNASAIDYEGFLNNDTNIWYQEVNNTGGYVSLAVTSLKPAPAKTGGSPPPLATVHFKAIGLGNSTLHLSKTVLADNQSIAILHTTADGEVASVLRIHDVAVTNVTSYKNVIFQGFTSNFTVTVENHGGFSETFNVSLNASNVVTVTQTMNNMPNGTSANITFAWNTTGFARGNYTISAYAWPVQGETNTADNTFTGGWVYVSMVGDVNGDGKVDGKDLGWVAWCFGSYPGVPPPMNWNPNCDTNSDGKIDGKDLGLVAYHFGEPHP
jgi:hypothetical protein